MTIRTVGELREALARFPDYRPLSADVGERLLVELEEVDDVGDGPPCPPPPPPGTPHG